MHIEIEGGVPLKGEVEISGSKNAGLLLLAATLLTDEPCEIKGLPDVTDIRLMKEIIGNLHGEKGPCGKKMRQLRASILLLGPLVARHGQCWVPQPGGCAIGPRPVDLHIKGLSALGATMGESHGMITADTAAYPAFTEGAVLEGSDVAIEMKQKRSRLKGTSIYLGGPHGSSVLATANVMMAATLARGPTDIVGFALEPEVEHLAYMLRVMGAHIVSAAGVMRITPRQTLKGGTFDVMPDRIEAATYLLAGMVTGGEGQYGDVILRGADYRHMDSVFWELTRKGDKYFDVHARPYPGFPTDVQPMMAAYLCTHRGGKITDHVFPNRFAYVHQLERMGANISCAGNSIRIIPAKLKGCDVVAQDLRGGAALVLAGLAAEGVTRVHGVEHIQRGYDSLVEKLQGLGARIRLIP